MLLRTKFDPPSIPGDLVVRPRLIDALYQGLNRPLALICAPAGYGKTVLAVSFLETCSLPSVWLSIDENDNDLRLFLDYLLAAIDSVFPGSVAGTQALLAGSNLPPVSAIADTLINELAGVGREFILALDDVHEVREPDIYSFLGALLKHPLRGLHLMLLTRREPALALGMLRARGQMTEIRSQDLRFSTEETAAFMARAINTALHDEAIAALSERTEGWAAGLRLAALTLRYGGAVAGASGGAVAGASGGDVDRRAAGFHAENRYVIDYLVGEVLARVPVETRDFLIKTSILNRLSGALCDAVVETNGAALGGQAQLEWLEDANLFTTSLDEERLWYRYHQLFRVLLQRELEHRQAAEEVRSLHRRASAWYASQGDIEEALRHALAGQDTLGAVQLVAQHRHHLLNTEQRPRLGRWLRLFSSATLAQDPDLLLAAAWCAQLGRTDPRRVMEMVDQAQALVDPMIGKAERARQLQGEIDTLRSTAKGFAANDPQGVIALATRALATMPEEWRLARSTAWLHLAAAYQMSGQLDRAHAVLAEGRREGATEVGPPRARVLVSSCFIYWMAADLPGLLLAAQHAIDLSQPANLYETLGWGHCFAAAGYYQRNDLAAAELHASIVQGQRYRCDPISVAQSAFVLATLHQMRDRAEEARLLLDGINDYLLETQSEVLVPVVQAFGAELAARQGDLEAAGHWAATVGPLVPLGAMAFFYAPQLTLPRVLLAMNTPTSRRQAAAALARLYAFVTETHNTRFTIDVLALRAVLHDAEGNETAALQTLEQAVALAQPGGLIRVFVDLGPSMAGLMARLARRSVALGFIEQILHAFPLTFSSHSLEASATRHPGPQANLIEPLTYRELDVLALLAQRLSAKEIAQALVISEATAKKHCANIYQKLAVNNRREAVAAAIALGLLPQQR